MTPDQADAAISRLCALFRGRIGKASRGAWADSLADLDASAVTNAIDHLARTEDRMPTIAAVVKAATRDANPPASRATFQVLVTWTDPQGLAFAKPSRWHDNEAAALADFEAARHWAARHANGHAELIRYEEGRPPQTIEQTR